MAEQTVVIPTDPALTAHIADTSNPHEVTATQLALDVQVRNHQTGTTYTIALTDSGVNAYLDTDNDTGIAVTIPLNETVETPNDGSVSGANTGAGAATFTGVSGVVLKGIGVTVDSGIYSFTVPAGGCAFSMLYLGSDTWQVFVGTSTITSDDITDFDEAVTANSTVAALGVEAASMHIPAPVNGTIYLEEYAMYAYTINEIRITCASGTITAAIKINGTAVTGISAVSVSSTQATGTATGANTVAVGDVVTLVLSSNSAAANLRYTIKLTR